MKLSSQDRQVHQQFSEYGRNAKEWLGKCALLLPEVRQREIWKKRGCFSIYEYAAKVAGMSRASVDEALWILHKVEDKPELKNLIEEKGLRSVRPILSIVTPETVPFWTEKARSMPRAALETYVRNYREGLIPGNKLEPVKKTVEITLDLARAAKLEQLGKRADFPELLDKLFSLAEEKERQEKPEAVATTSRHIPVKIDKFVRERTGGLCAFPACRKAGTSLHHTQRWTLENVHDPDRLHLVCTAHERMAHAGLIENEELAPEHWKIREYARPLGPKAYVDRLVSLHRQR